MRPDKPLLVPLAPSKLCVGPLTSTQHFLLALYWMPTTLSYIALAVLLLPDAIAQIVGTEQKAVVLSTIVSLGAVVQLLGPWFGQLSDGFGRRRTPFMVVGTVLLVPGLLAVALGARVSICAAGYLVYQLFSTLAVQPYTATVADHVVPAERGRASGLVFMMQFLGSVGAAVLGLLYGASIVDKLTLYLIIAAANVIGVVATTWIILRLGDGDAGAGAWRALGCRLRVCRSCRERCGNEGSEVACNVRDKLVRAFCVLASPFRRSSRFCWLFALSSSYAAAGGVSAMFIQYYIHDCLVSRCDGAAGPAPGLGQLGKVLGGLHGAQSAASCWLLFNLGCSSLATIVGGAMLDTRGVTQDNNIGGRVRGERSRAGTVLGCGLLIGAAGNFGLAFAQSFGAFVVCGCVLGASTGLVAAPAWALAVETLPSEGDQNAKDMSIYFLNTLCPQLFVPIVCGQILGANVWQEKLGRGYSTVFAIGGAMAMLSLLCLQRMRRAEEPQSFTHVTHASSS